MSPPLYAPLSYDEIRGSIYNVVAATGSTSSNWKPGAVARTIISGVSLVLAGFSAFISLLAEQIFFPFATGEWLRLLAFYVFNVVRVEATFATGSVTLVNVSATPYSVTAGALTVRNPATHQKYINLNPFTLPASSSLTIAIAATEEGAAGTSFGGEITEMVTLLTGVTCRNAEPVIGSDVEGPAELRARCRNKVEPFSPDGASDAYRYVATNAKRPDGSPVGITRVTARPNNAAGTIAVYLAGPAGPVPAADVAIVDDLIQRNCVPLCVTCTTTSATPVGVQIRYRLWLYNTPGMTAAEIFDAINVELTNYLAAVPIGGDVVDDAQGKLFVSELAAVIGRARKPDGTPLHIVAVELDGPAADLLLPPDAILVPYIQPLAAADAPLDAVATKIFQITATQS